MIPSAQSLFRSIYWLTSTRKHEIKSKMKICAAQTRPSKGDIQRNIDNHKELVDLAVSKGADTVIFPELSYGYFSTTQIKKNVFKKVLTP